MSDCLDGAAMDGKDKGELSWSPLRVCTGKEKGESPLQVVSPSVCTGKDKGNSSSLIGRRGHAQA